jgi:hypothetical protein
MRLSSSVWSAAARHAQPRVRPARRSPVQHLLEQRPRPHEMRRAQQHRLTTITPAVQNRRSGIVQDRPPRDGSKSMSVLEVSDEQALENHAHGHSRRTRAAWAPCLASLPQEPGPAFAA